MQSALTDQIEFSRAQSELKRNLFREANKEVPSFPTRNYFGTFSGPAQPPAGAPTAPAAGAVNIEEERSRAQQAISSGRDAAAVRARFKERTGQDL